MRPTRLALGVVIGLITTGFGIASHGLHVVNSGLDRYDVTGLGMIVGGLLLVAAGVAAVAAPPRAPRPLGRRLAHGTGWLAGALMVTHAPRWEIHESSLGIPHEEVRIAAFGSSLGGEVRLEAAARDERIGAVVSDGAARPEDQVEVNGGNPIAQIPLTLAQVIAGERPAPSLIHLMPRIAPRPVLLSANEIPTNRAYRDAGPSAELYEIPEAGHTSGLAARPKEYEARV